MVGLYKNNHFTSILKMAKQAWFYDGLNGKAERIGSALSIDKTQSVSNIMYLALY